MASEKPGDESNCIDFEPSFVRTGFPSEQSVFIGGDLCIVGNGGLVDRLSPIGAEGIPALASDICTTQAEYSVTAP